MITSQLFHPSFQSMSWPAVGSGHQALTGYSGRGVAMQVGLAPQIVESGNRIRCPGAKPRETADVVVGGGKRSEETMQDSNDCLPTGEGEWSDNRRTESKSEHPESRRDLSRDRILPDQPRPGGSDGTSAQPRLFPGGDDNARLLLMDFELAMDELPLRWPVR